MKTKIIAASMIVTCLLSTPVLGRNIGQMSGFRVTGFYNSTGYLRKIGSGGYVLNTNNSPQALTGKRLTHVLRNLNNENRSNVNEITISNRGTYANYASAGYEYKLAMKTVNWDTYNLVGSWSPDS